MCISLLKSSFARLHITVNEMHGLLQLVIFKSPPSTLVISYWGGKKKTMLSVARNSSYQNSGLGEIERASIAYTPSHDSMSSWLGHWFIPHTVGPVSSQCRTSRDSPPPHAHAHARFASFVGWPTHSSGTEGPRKSLASDLFLYCGWCVTRWRRFLPTCS